MGGFLPEFLATSSRPEFWTPLAARDFLDGVVAEFLCIVYFLILFFSFFFVHFFLFHKSSTLVYLTEDSSRR